VDAGGIWILRRQFGAWQRELVPGTEGLLNNPASLAVDTLDPELFYIGTYGRSADGQVGPSDILRLRISDGRLAEQLKLNNVPMAEDYLVAVVPIGDYVYYLGRRTVGRVLRDGGAVETLITLPAWVDARGMATDGRHLFVITSAQDIIRLDLRGVTLVTLLAKNPANPQLEELRNLAVDREGHVMAVTTSQTGTAHLYRFHSKTGGLLNTVQLPMTGARAVVQDPTTGDVFVSGGLSNLESIVVRLVAWQVQETLLSAVPQALPSLVVPRPGPFFTHGTGCPDKSGRVPQTTGVSPVVGGRATAQFAGPANQPVVLLVGRHVDQKDDRLPVDLGVLGAPGCELDLTSFVAISGGTDAGGVAALGFWVFPSHLGMPYWMRIQWAALAPGANAARLAVSPSATLVLRTR